MRTQSVPCLEPKYKHWLQPVLPELALKLVMLGVDYTQAEIVGEKRSTLTQAAHEVIFSGKNSKSQEMDADSI